MTIYDEDGWYGTYPVVFGSKSQEDKKMEGAGLHLKEVLKLLEREL